MEGHPRPDPSLPTLDGPQAEWFPSKSEELTGLGCVSVLTDTERPNRRRVLWFFRIRSLTYRPSGVPQRPRFNKNFRQKGWDG